MNLSKLRRYFAGPPLPLEPDAFQFIDRVRFQPDSTSREPILNAFLPALVATRMTGGPNTILQILARVAQRGVPCRLWSCFTDPDTDFAALSRHVETVTGIDPCSIPLEFAAARPGKDSFAIGPNDALCATHWVTAHIAAKARDGTSRPQMLYIAQDYEPGFEPWSAAHALATETYEFDVYPIVNEPTLARFFAQQGFPGFIEAVGQPARVFLPAVSRQHFHPEPKPNGAPFRLLFYARPKQPRFLFELGLRALRRAIEQHGFGTRNWEFLSIGEPLPAIDLGSGATLINRPWLAFEAYAALMRSADVVLSLMLSPHTSYPPLEGAAAGATVVTTTFETKTADELKTLSPDIIPAAPTTAAITAALRDAASAAATRAAKQDRLSLPSDWSTAVGPAAEAISTWFHQPPAAQSTPERRRDAG